MDNNELEFKKAVVQSENIKTVFHFFSVVATLGVIYLCIDKSLVLLSSVAGNSPQSIEALAKLVEKLQLSKLTGTIVGVLGVGYGAYERKGKKEAVKKVDHFRKQVEAQDPYNGSSGLTKTGETPKPKGKK